MFAGGAKGRARSVFWAGERLPKRPYSGTKKKAPSGSNSW